MSHTHDFFRFPHTPHIAWLASGTPRDDKVLSPDEAQSLLQHPVVVEEKLDGANMGISFSSEAVLHVQNRGQYLNKPYGGQFSRLDEWLAIREGDDRPELKALEEALNSQEVKDYINETYHGTVIAVF